MNFKCFLSLLLCFSIWSWAAGQGAMSGTIKDETSGEPLIGANIVIEGTGIGSASDFDGNYQFKAEPGVYTMLVSYLGYNDKKIEGVEIKSGETTYLDILLSDQSVELDLEVVVQAKAIERSENALLLLQKKSDKIQDGISAREMSKLGVSNAATALKKVTGTTIVGGKYVYVRGLGDRYSATLLNGIQLPSIDPYRNSAQLDLIPANILDNIITAKTFTPDLPGNFTGGSVNIKTKSFPERFTLNFSASFGYNPQSNFQEDFLTFDTGERGWLGYNDGSLDRPTIVDDPQVQDILDRSGPSSARRDDEVAQRLDGAVRSFNQQFAPVASTSSIDRKFALSLGNQFSLGNKSLGLLFTINYSDAFDHYSDALNANYFNTGSAGSTSLTRNFSLRETRSTRNPTIGGLFGLSFKFNPNNVITYYTIYNHNTAIDARFLGNGDYIDFDVLEPEEFQSRTLSFREREQINNIVSGQHVFSRLNNLRIEWAASFSDATQDEPDLRFFANKFNPEETRPNRSPYSISTANYNPPSHFFRALQDNQFEGKLDITIPFLTNKGKGNKLKFGGLYSKKDREFNEQIYSVFNFFGETYAGDPNFYFGDENIGIIGTDNSVNTIGLYIVDETQINNNYSGSTEIWAGYGMLTFQINERLKIIGGARVEGTDIFVESDGNAFSEEDESTRIDEVDILPSANLIFSLTDNMNIRASYSNTLARPNMREVAPFGSFGFIGDPTVFGNRELTRTRINNYDLRYEWFQNPGEIIAVSGFYKKFQDPIVLTYRPAGNPQFTWKNSNDATVLGAELEFRKNLNFISPALEGFKLGANLAIISSQVDVDSTELAINRSVDPDFPETRRFNGQSPFVVNANLSYTHQESGLDIVLAYNVFGNRLQTVGVEGTPDLFERSRNQLDFSISKDFGDHLSVKLGVRNILNPSYETFATFLDQEFIYTSYKLGRAYTFGFTYKI